MKQSVLPTQLKLTFQSSKVANIQAKPVVMATAQPMRTTSCEDVFRSRSH